MRREVLDNHFRMLQQLHNARELQRTMTAKAEKEKGNTRLLVALLESLADVNRSISYFEKEITESSPDVVAFIDSVKAPRVRQLLRLRYQYGLAWCQIPQFAGTGSSEASCKSLCYRFLREHCS